MAKKATVLPIRLIGDKVLRQVAEPIDEITDEIRQFIEDLKLTMYKRDGLGLAAPQVGKSLRIFVIDPQWVDTHKKKPIVFINPKFVEFRGEDSNEEGCLSLPGIFADVKRAEEVIIEAMNENGELFQMEASGLTAVALQHENDHLDGKLFIDHVPKLKLLPLRRHIRALEKSTDAEGNNIRN
jgi:peptide deformylase